MEMEGPKWEDLNMDCLGNIFGRVGMANLLLDVPYVCKSWCPNIRTLQLPRNTRDDLKSALPFLISKWKSLVNLTFPWDDNAQEVFKQLGIHCKNFETLKIYNGRIEDDGASALATHLPNLKALSMRSAGITKENLLVILKSCTKLEFMDARDCVGFEENDDEILNATAHIHSAKLQGSKVDVLDDEDYYPYDDDY